MPAPCVHDTTVNTTATESARALPRVVVLGLASCFGCQLQITNVESHLLDVLGQIDLSYWQLASSGHMPSEYDIAVIEGAVTTTESLELVREVRSKARTVISIGACANTAGIPGMAADALYDRAAYVYARGGEGCSQVDARICGEGVDGGGASVYGGHVDESGSSCADESASSCADESNGERDDKSNGGRDYVNSDQRDCESNSEAAVNTEREESAVPVSCIPAACGELIEPRAVSSVIPVDAFVPCCPIDPFEFIAVLARALYGSNIAATTRTMCGDCKRNETPCFFGQGKLCLGLVTRAGCGARCVNLGRACRGCRGISPDANLHAAREAVQRYGVAPEAFDEALELFSKADPMRLAYCAELEARAATSSTNSSADNGATQNEAVL